MVGSGGARVSIGLGTDPGNRDLCTMGPQFGWLARMPASGNWRLEIDLAAYEAAANPDGGLPDSNPYGLLAEPGSTVATDAGGNSLLRVRANGSISTLAVFPSRSTGRGTDSVPTSVAVGPDGAYYVGELTGFPFLQGAANVWRVVPGQAPTVLEPGFTSVIDITFGPDGSLYVLEFASESGLTGPGDLWRIAPNGDRTLVATGFVTPGSVVMGRDGAFYVSNCSIFPGAGPFPCNGEVVRIPG
jgi:sugar lactone lactonase YvrE